ncbi:UDP-galactose/UDP-glucose transporter 3-like [Hibiscus syriacus]|uniref:UDP-galactose/UDP-glucose transporter 3-like n=1 Tax=Hibiscus syriacus TaxID=106335 RepID=A0A6A3BWG4_HIBSY|nr:UDP-galactose/UDP-glucose transporter 3-like [Hibiscus syriacus]
MQETRKKKNGGAGGNEDSKKKERHIVTWTQEEDDILREQISLHGTQNWAIIASKFKDKTTRQCRRRWYTYLNSDFKKGGWSPEEDVLLCSKIFGNRWTEIAKVVSGRTDNAVKNRFSTLCKKRAKYEALAKENSNSCMNPNNKRTLLEIGFNTDGTTDCTAPVKRMRRSHIPNLGESCNFGDRAHRVSGTIINQQLRHPFAVLGQNIHNANNLVVQSQVNKVNVVSNDAQNYRIQGTYLKKDDPKITALMQQAELLSSLALKVNIDNTDQSLENAWKVLQDFLNQSKENDTLRYTISDIDFQIEDFKDLLEDLRSSNEGSQTSWRQPDLYEVSPSSSEYSTGSTQMPHPAGESREKTQSKINALHPDIMSNHIGEQRRGTEEEKRALSSANTDHVEIITSSDVQTNMIVASTSSSAEFSSPVQVNPIFRSLAAGIPSPKFSESERNFLLKTLGMESPSPNPVNNPSQPPPCKRALLHSL